MSRSVRLKDHWAEQRLFGRRVLAATTVILVCLAALFSRLVYLQVVRHDYFSDLSQGNRIRIDPVPPSRGLIFDRNGVPLALNRPAYQLEVTRELTPDLPDTLHRLVGLGLMPAEGLYVLLARIFTALYFAYFLLMPWYTSVEKTKPVPDRVTYHA